MSSVLYNSVLKCFTYFFNVYNQFYRQLGHRLYVDFGTRQQVLYLLEMPLSI